MKTKFSSATSEILLPLDEQIKYKIMSSLKIAVVQFNIQWKDPEANFETVRVLTKDVEADLFVLPEMFATGFCIEDTSAAQEIGGSILRFLTELSIEKEACIATSFMCKTQAITNRFIAVNKGEIIHYYDKIHLFKAGKEDTYLSPGDGVSDFILSGIKIRPLICYDLRFPYVSYNSSGYDILLYTANWPSARIAHWDSLLVARAVENQSFVVACNRVGEQDGHFYPGHSAVINPTGEVLEQSHKEEIMSVEININEVKEIRNKLPFLQDQKTHS